jgi:hypothetical protein
MSGEINHHHFFSSWGPSTMQTPKWESTMWFHGLKQRLRREMTSMMMTANHFPHVVRPWSYGRTSHFLHGTSDVSEQTVKCTFPVA